MVDLHAPDSVAAYLGRLWRVRGFIAAMPAADLRARHAEHRLGWAWMVLNPLFFSGVYYLLFGVLFNTSRGIDNFVTFLVIGVFCFQFTARSVSAAMWTLNANARLIQSLRFPKAALPTATTLSETYVHVPGLAVMLVVALLTSVRPSLSWVLILPATVIQAVFNLGLALIIARLSFGTRDIINVVPHALRLWLYLSGVLFGVDLLAQRGGPVVVDIFQANPMWIYLRMYRDALLGGSANPSTWLWGTVYAVTSLIIGLLFFKAREHHYSRV